MAAAAEIGVSVDGLVALIYEADEAVNLAAEWRLEAQERSDAS